MKPLLKRQILLNTPWVTVRAKHSAGGGEPYYTLEQVDYVAILAVTPEGRFPIVRQFRPAVEEETFELPAGRVDAGEAPEETARRELLEETGLVADQITFLASLWPDTGRLENRQHAFYIQTRKGSEAVPAEPGITVEYWTATELKRRIRDGTFRNALHLAVLFMADLVLEKGLWQRD